jgi:hypothetical protein
MSSEDILAWNPSKEKVREHLRMWEIEDAEMLSMIHQLLYQN